MQNSRNECKNIDVPERSLGMHYSKNMEGVVRIDKNVSYYRVQFRA